MSEGPFIPGTIPRRHKHSGGREFMFQGKMMRVSDIAHITGIPANTIRTRILSGKTPDEAFANTDYRDSCYKPPQKSVAKKFNYRGEMLTMKDISERTGVSLGTIYSRYYSGWKIDDLGKEARKRG